MTRLSVVSRWGQGSPIHCVNYRPFTLNTFGVGSIRTLCMLAIRNGCTDCSPKKHSFYQDSSIPYLMNLKIMKKNSMLNIIKLYMEWYLYIFWSCEFSSYFPLNKILFSIWLVLQSLILNILCIINTCIACFNVFVTDEVKRTKYTLLLHLGPSA